MLTLRNIVILLLALNGMLFVVFFRISTRTDNSVDNTAATTTLTGNNTADSDTTSDLDQVSEPSSTDNRIAFKKNPRREEAARLKQHNIELVDRVRPKNVSSPIHVYNSTDPMSLANPFFILGAYPPLLKKYLNTVPKLQTKYKSENYGLINDDAYCASVDLFNYLTHENIKEKWHIFTDFPSNGYVRKDVIKTNFTDTMPHISEEMTLDIYNQRLYHLNPNITMFFTKIPDFHFYHKMGQHFLCGTQVYNHIPGSGSLRRKDLFTARIHSYVQRYNDTPECFNNKSYFPQTYRLHDKQECLDFWRMVDTPEYQKRKKEQPAQFVIKIGYGAQQTNGVFLFDTAEEKYLQKFYGVKGTKCGKIRRALLAQKLIANPLLLDKKNKFDVRVYMLIASTNPLIVYYHDGYVQTGLVTYDVKSNKKDVHFISPGINKKLLAQALKKKSFANMTEDQIKDYSIWTFNDLQKHLLETKKVNDTHWVDNYLRKELQKALIHAVRLSKSGFMEHSGVFEIYAVDFEIDSNMNLWYLDIESTLVNQMPTKIKRETMVNMFKDLFDIQLAYYQSRMIRIMKVIKKVYDETRHNVTNVDYSHWQQEFAKENKNTLDSTHQILANNTWIKIADLNEEGAKRYSHLIDAKCIDD
jgi:hypothetical protein